LLAGLTRLLRVLNLVARQSYQSWSGGVVFFWGSPIFFVDTSQTYFRPAFASCQSPGQFSFSCFATHVRGNHVRLKKGCVPTEIRLREPLEQPRPDCLPPPTSSFILLRYPPPRLPPLIADRHCFCRGICPSSDFLGTLPQQSFSPAYPVFCPRETSLGCSPAIFPLRVFSRSHELRSPPPKPCTPFLPRFRPSVCA